MSPLAAAPAARLRAALVPTALALAASGCAGDYLRDTTDWHALHRQAETSVAGDTLAQKGFTACRNLFEDAILHATEARDNTPVVSHSPAGIDLRPVSAMIAYADKGDTVHADVLAGVDGSGRCFANWRISRVWRASCRRLEAELEWLRPYAPFAEPSPRTTAYRADGSGITVFLTRVGFGRCLMTAGETVYWEGEGQDVPEVNHLPFSD